MTRFLLFHHYRDTTGESEVRDYLSAHGVSARVFAEAASLGLKTRATPTLALVDGAGSVQSAWTGLLDTAGEREVEKSLTGVQSLRH
jgi:hypothetical protein